MAGFYGDNIIASMSAMADFNFDKIYSNRFEMDSNNQTDGVYQGRYVLVEYSQKFDIIPFQIHKPKMGEEQEDGKIYYKCAFLNKQEEDYIKVNQFSGLGVIYYNEDEQFYNVYRKVNKDTYEQEDDLFFEATTNPIALKDTGDNVKSDFIINQAIDNEIYGGAKGYDSTVWIKRILNEGEKYVEVGSLNAVEPQFDLYIDSPLEFDEIDDPLRKGPYFDDKSTGLVKNLHIQAPWRFELGAIEFNEKGFKPETPSIDNTKNQITLSTKRSEIKYKYANEGEKETYPDTQVLNINIPSIGNVMSKVWDIVHGSERDNPKTSSIQGILNSFEEIPNDTFPIKRASDGQIVGAAFNQALENSVNYKYYGNANIYPTSIGLFEIVNTVGDKVTLTFKADKKEILQELPIIAIPYEYIDTNQNVFEVNAFQFPVNIEILTLKTLYVPSTVKTISSQKGNNIVTINSIKINSVLQDLQLPYFYCQDNIINIMPDSSNFNCFIWGGKFQGIVFDKVLNFQNNLADIDKIYLYNAETIEQFSYGYSTTQTKIFLPATLSKINQIQKPNSGDILPIFYYEGLREDFKKIEGCDKIIDLEDAQKDKFLIYYKNDEEYKNQIRGFEEIKLNFELNRYKELDRWIQASVQYNNEDKNPYINIEHLKVNPEIATQYKLGPFNFVIDEAGHIINTAHQEEMIFNCGGAQL